MTEAQPDGYTTGAVAAQLGVGTSMARRYGLALESVRGEPLQQIPGRGRIYTAEDLRVLTEARGIMLEHPHITVEDAVRRVLGLPSQPSPSSEGRPGEGFIDHSEDSSVIRVEPGAWDALAGALAVMQADQQALLAEVRSLRRALPNGDVPLAQDPVRMLEVYRQKLEAQEAELDRLRSRPWWRFWDRG